MRLSHRLCVNKYLLNAFRLPSLYFVLIIIASILTVNFVGIEDIRIILVIIIFSFVSLIGFMFIKIENHLLSCLKIIFSIVLLYFSMVLFVYPYKFNSENHIRNYIFFSDKIEEVKYKVKGFPSFLYKEKKSTYIFDAEVIGLSSGEEEITSCGNVKITYIGAYIGVNIDDIIVSKEFPHCDHHKFCDKGFIERSLPTMNLTIKENDIIRIDYDDKPLNDFMLSLRNRVRTFFSKHLSDLISTISIATILGDRNHLECETLELFSSTSTIHLLAISGLHIGIVIVILNFILTKIGVGGAYKILLLAPIVVFICFLTGNRPSIIRASLLMFIGIVSIVYLGRRFNPLNILFISASIMLVAHPPFLFDIGFQLSFASVFSIMFFFLPLVRIFEISIFKKKDSVYVKLAKNTIFYPMVLALLVQITTYPIIIFYFGTYNISGFISAIFTINIFSIFLPVLLIFLMLSFLPNVAIVVFSYVVEFLGKLMVTMLEIYKKVSFEIEIEPPMIAYALTVWFVMFIFMSLLFIGISGDNKDDL